LLQSGSFGWLHVTIRDGDAIGSPPICKLSEEFLAPFETFGHRTPYIFSEPNDHRQMPMNTPNETTGKAWLYPSDTVAKYIVATVSERRVPINVTKVQRLPYIAYCAYLALRDGRKS